MVRSAGVSLLQAAQVASLNSPAQGGYGLRLWRGGECSPPHPYTVGVLDPNRVVERICLVGRPLHHAGAMVLKKGENIDVIDRGAYE